MADSQELEMYKIYLSTAEKVSERRSACNSWMLTLNSSLIGLHSAIDKLQTPASAAGSMRSAWLLPIAGLAASISWALMLRSFAKLNRAKFEVLQGMEKKLSAAPLTEEQKIYSHLGRHGLSRLESAIPLAFCVIYSISCLGLMRG